VRDANELGDRLLVIFDGQCGFCNRSVRWLLRHDTRDRLRFAASQSSAMTAVLARLQTDEPTPQDGPGTILVIRNFASPTECVFVRSDATLTLLAELPRPWPSVATALAWIPHELRDFGYRTVARWRHKISGRLSSCPLPTNEERAHFL
jgi:predicted DCC family thiol-disulfide oxidoreductase YuxK